MLTAYDLMTQNPQTIAPEDDVVTAARIMLDKRYNGLPVVEADGTLIGIICQSDLINQHKRLNVPSFFTVLDGLIPLGFSSNTDAEIRKISASTVAEAMTPAPASVTEETPIDEIATLMVDNKYHSLPVVKNGKLVGIVGKEDILRTLLPKEEPKE
ncbi:CBS domain-containing protein [Halodesulfovibrio aestuarii]|uniref:CBS domain-containing protein n=1 Tax=Halodesulfovibrio aestuarii TaxID=126333 RepID=A0A8G2C7H3_9BACT|nr:CBS domain-containing protein [Halodesulfovibrio aestuarii]SHI64025.1 CBS domain-containing protein [Halodesulfovibrio aestuarii]